MVETAGHRRFRLSIRTLMIAVALCALFLAPLVLMLRQLELQRRTELVALEARALAEERAAALARFTQAGLGVTNSNNAAQPKAENLWAALAVNRPIFKHGQTKDLRVEFSLVNDGDKVIDPKIAESHIVINGKELADSGLILTGVAKDARFNPLAPGESLQFSLVLGNQFKEPGTYRVCWKGAGFQSSEVVLRILPETAR
jgi:hypothetical protein